MGEIAAQLAVHFERGGETSRAICYWQQVAAQAARRHVHHDATSALTNALVLLSMRGDAAGVAPIRQRRAATDDAGLKLFRPYFLSALAEACGQAGHPGAGLTIMAEASTLVAATGEQWWEAEVSRLQGDLRLQLPVPDIQQAEAYFQQALTLACGQQAKSLELRAALSLTRLWQQQGKWDEARDWILLANPNAGTFTLYSASLPIKRLGNPVQKHHP
jgi:predicted ATPase